MNESAIDKVRANPKFAELVRKKTRLGWLLSAVMLLIYYGFILILAFSPDTLGRPLFSGATMTVGIPVGVMIILSAFILTGVYVYIANTRFDQLNQEIVEESKQ